MEKTASLDNSMPAGIPGSDLRYEKKQSDGLRAVCDDVDRPRSVLADSHSTAGVG